jgi:hypothetical protein
MKITDERVRESTALPCGGCARDRATAALLAQARGMVDA